MAGDITAGPCSLSEHETHCRLSAKYLDFSLFLRKGFLSFHSLINLCYSGQSAVLTEICTHKKRLMKRKMTFFFFFSSEKGPLGDAFFPPPSHSFTPFSTALSHLPAEEGPLIVLSAGLAGFLPHGVAVFTVSFSVLQHTGLLWLCCCTLQTLIVPYLSHCLP